jgi:glycine/D-amino acid oxidase-like deaminating enzyme
LTCALDLQQAYGNGKDVMIVARDWPYDESIHYTSPWAGAQGRPVPAMTAVEKQHQAFSSTTNSRMKQLALEEPHCGVKMLDGYYFMASPTDAYLGLQGGYADADDLTVLGEERYPKGMGIRFGTRYRTWTLNTLVYCAYLLRKFQLRGGKIMKATLMSAQEALALADNIGAVVNCSGFGMGDPDIYPIRGEDIVVPFCTLADRCAPFSGQTCLVANPCDRAITQQNADGTWTFIIPRPLDGGTIVGGTKEPNDFEEKPRPETRDHILSMVAKMYPPILGPEGKFHIIRDIVGRRPARRGGLRLEIEGMKPPHNGKKIIHAYGAEGHGYALSWGVAREVVKMAVGDGGEVTARASL